VTCPLKPPVHRYYNHPRPQCSLFSFRPRNPLHPPRSERIKSGAFSLSLNCSFYVRSRPLVSSLIVPPPPPTRISIMKYQYSDEELILPVVSREKKKMQEQNKRGETKAGRVVNNAIFLLTRIFLKQKRTSFSLPPSLSPSLSRICRNLSYSKVIE